MDKLMLGSGLYIVTLNNSQPISVNAHDPRRRDKVIKVNKENCKFGKAKDLGIRRKNYFKTFGEENVNYHPIIGTDEIEFAEKMVLKELDAFRICSLSGRKNEWLCNILPEAVFEMVVKTLELNKIKYRLLPSLFWKAVD